ncbi:MAG: hypothetical protein JJE52_18900 [Acidimicrobiia bacterium]|nr:hypothetical protein [Acidimicrobiia bacterium]
MPTTEHNHGDQQTNSLEPAPSGGHQMDSRMMWVMMLGCCLAIPLALIVGGASFVGFAGASLWLIGAGVVLAVALLVVRRRSAGAACDMPPGRHG